MATKKKSEHTENEAITALMSGKELSDVHRKEVKAIAEGLIDGFMRSVGYVDPSRSTDPNGFRHLQLGSAEGVAGVTDLEGALYLHVAADVMPIPSDKDLIQALMRAALELNCGLPGTSSLGIRGTMLVVTATVNLRWLGSPAEYADCIHNVMALANAIDDDFKKTYGGTTRMRNTVAVAVPA